MPQLWDRLNTETPEAYAAFTTFRDLGIERGLDAAYRKQTGKTTRATGRWFAWRKQHNWDVRAIAWDTHQQNVKDQAVIATLGENESTASLHRHEHLKLERELVQILREKILEMATYPLAKRRTAFTDDGKQVIVHEPMKWTMKTMVDAVRVISTLGRVVNQMPTLVEESSPQDLRDLFFDTAGELEDATPAAATPPMPEDPLSKPPLPGGNGHANGNGNGHGPRQPPIVRPP